MVGQFVRRIGDRFTGRGRRASAGTAAGVKIVGEMLRRDAGRTCPIDTGTLRNSARADFRGKGRKAESIVSYAAPYAIYPHEKPGLRYQGPGRRKWLALTAQEQAGKYNDVIRNEVRKAVEGR